VVICVYTEQRWDDSLAAIASVRSQHPVPQQILVVVDHNPELLGRLSAHFAHDLDVTVVENTAARGLSGGKNTGVAHATADVVAFLDDDAVAEPGWLATLAADFADPAVLGVGGTTLPAWETGRPRWWPGEFDWVVGCTFVGRRPGVVRNLLGGNASFRRRLFDDVGGFAQHIGRSSSLSRPLGCEETELCIRMNRSHPGGVFLFEPRAVIHHRVPRARERFSYFRSRCFAEGLSKAEVTRSVGVRDGLEAERSYAAVALRRGVLRGLADLLRGDVTGPLRAGAIVTGLGWTIGGYLAGLAAPLRAGRAS
jgi:GT2 family glycosyltransferase